MPEEDVVKRIMPHNLEAEMSVVGAMLMDQQAIGSVMELLTPDDFYSRQYGLMYESILELEQSGMAVDPVTLQEKLKEYVGHTPIQVAAGAVLGIVIAFVMNPMYA